MASIILINIFKNRSILCFDAKNYNPDIKDLNISKLNTKITNSSNLELHYDNMEVCLSYSRFIHALSCKDNIINNINKYLNNYKLLQWNNYTYVIIKKNLNIILITFRGSINLENIDLDFKTSLVPIDQNDKCKVYSGVYDYLNRFLPKIETYIENNFMINNIYITGFSLGAATSIICSYLLKKKFPKKNIFNYSFGSMKIGNKDFVEKYNNSDIVKVLLLNKNDPVTKFPFNKKYYHINSLNTTKNANIDIYKNSTKSHYPSSYYENIRNSFVN